MQKQATLFKALSDETRLQIMALLSLHGELCVCDFEGLLEISQSKSSRHLRYLFNAGLVQNRRAGQWIYYRLPDAPDAGHRVVLEALEALLDGVQRRALKKRLRAWFKRKATQGPGCSSASA